MENLLRREWLIAPHRMTAHVVDLLCNLLKGIACKIFFKDKADDPGIRIRYKLTVFRVISENPVAAVNICPCLLPLSDSPLHVLRNRLTLALCNEAHQGEDHARRRVHRAQRFLFKVNLHAVALQLCHVALTVHDVPGESADALHQNQVNLAINRILDTCHELWPLLSASTGNALISVDPGEVPFVMAPDVILVIFLLGLVGFFLRTFHGAHPAIGRYPFPPPMPCALYDMYLHDCTSG